VRPILYNHARTLLLNLTGSDNVFSDYPGDELIPAEFQKLELNTTLDVFRSRIFGASPDRAMLNYRVNQLLQIIEATKLQDYVLQLDPRITYNSYRDKLVRPDTFQPKVSRYAGPSSAVLSLTGNPARPDITGRCEYNYQVTISSGSVRVARLSLPNSVTESPITLTSGLSDLFQLPGSGYQFRINTTDPTSAWKVHGFLRPQMALSEIENSFYNVGESYLIGLFGAAKVEPYLTFWNCTKHPEFAYRLGGFILALIYRTEEIRNG